jgi:hypothetical protein
VKENNPFAKQIMNTTNYYSMGIDAHKQFCQIHILHPDGSVHTFQFDEAAITSGPLFTDQPSKNCFFRVEVILP